MPSSRGWLLYGLCVLACCCVVTGIRYLPPKAIHFTQCLPSENKCPANAICDEYQGNKYYCACETNFFNDKERTTVTYPGGECIAVCNSTAITSRCVCSLNTVKKRNDKGLYICTDKCTDDSDCPKHAFCAATNTCDCDSEYCSQRPKRSIIPCIRSVKIDEECKDPCSFSPPHCKSPKVCVSSKGTYTCNCPPGFHEVYDTVLKTWMCSDKCTNNSHCPAHAVCVQNNCYCDSGFCAGPSSKGSCITLLQSGEECTGERNCQSQPSTELEKCERLNRQDAFCSLLKSSADIQNKSCQANNTSISVKDVALQFTEVLSKAQLTNLTTSELSTTVITILQNVETSLLATFTKDPRNQNINTPELEVEMKVSFDICGGETSSNTSITLNVLNNTMKVPCPLMSRKTDGAMFVNYKGLNSSALGALGDPDHEGEQEIISLVVSGAITSPNTENLDPPVSFYLKHLKDRKPSFVFQCVFWDMKKRAWSSVGCTTKKSDIEENSTFCVCTHLSTFAVLMAPGEIQVDVGLEVISRIGLTVSLVCLCLSLLTFTLCRSLRSAHTSVLIVLCGCLFLGQLLVLFGLRQTSNTVLCSVIAGSLHFFFLCAFCWMSIESILLFMTVRNLRAMNYMTSQRSHFPYVCLLGFGIPLIIVAISAAIRSDGYRNDKYCWLALNLIWSFIGPVCVFIIINAILLLLTFWLLKKKLASLNSNVSTLKHTRLLTFKALSQLFILGCTWIIGLFQFGGGSLVVSYIFTICNSLQGVYIFLVHCLLNRQVRAEYSRGFRRLRSRKSESEVVSGSTVPIKLSEVSEVQKTDTLSKEEKNVGWEK
ncbi:adhesion G protein-coupled receptor E3-like isoform X2 [Mixophyes fleayi]|uniref:adhesion G protein-coupled receptor E3-like isoform X2 n=1 Tax=Mixophyes fleayi TaxID=3061075 RepID=UPI003F4D81CC